MKVYTYSQARQKLSELLNEALRDEVLIRRRDGSLFSVTSKKQKKSPFDIEGMDIDVSAEDIVNAVRESREQYGDLDK